MKHRLETHMNIVIMGRPAVEKVRRDIFWQSISTWDIFQPDDFCVMKLKKRANRKRAMPYLETGLNVPDEIIIQLIENEIKEQRQKRIYFQRLPEH